MLSSLHGDDECGGDVDANFLQIQGKVYICHTADAQFHVHGIRFIAVMRIFLEYIELLIKYQKQA